MSPIAFSEMLALKAVERPKSNRVTVNVWGDDEGQVTNVARAVRFGVGVLGATTEAVNVPAETAESGGLDKMQGVTVRVEACNDFRTRPWPHDGEEFDAFFAVLPAAEREHGVDVHWIDPPEQAQEVINDYGRMGVVTDELFNVSAESLLEKIGLHRVRVRFWFDDREDHEGNRDAEFGFEIVSVEEVKS
ncbi:hypothetical protein SB778_03910 [Paraburkholderia sp. SIMBA_050]